MKTNRMHGRPSANRRRIFVLALLATFQWIGVAPAAFASDLVVIVHKADAPAAMDLDQVKRIYKGDQKKWPGGSNVIPILPPSGSDAMKAIVSSVLGMTSEDELAQFYMAAIFQQKITVPPDSLPAAEAAARVASVAGAIAVVPRTAAGTDVAVLEVSGL